MRRKVKIQKISVGSTKQQIEDQMNVQLTKGWSYVGIIPFEGSTYLVFEKTVVG